MSYTFEDAQAEADEQDPKGSDICPACGGFHVFFIQGTRADVIVYWCEECPANWWVSGGVGLHRWSDA